MRQAKLLNRLVAMEKDAEDEEDALYVEDFEGKAHRDFQLHPRKMHTPGAEKKGVQNVVLPIALPKGTPTKVGQDKKISTTS